MDQMTDDYVRVKTMIEQYLQYYYTYDQIIAELSAKGVEEDTAKYILQCLIEQNRDYFTAYEIRVALNGLSFPR